MGILLLTKRCRKLQINSYMIPPPCRYEDDFALYEWTIDFIQWHVNSNDLFSLLGDRSMTHLHIVRSSRFT